MDITEIIVALIGLLGIIITSVIVPYIKSKTTKQQQETILSIAKIAVYAAQQLFESNTDKFNYASNYMYTMLDNAGLKVNMEIVTAAIESVIKHAKIDNPNWNEKYISEDKQHQWCAVPKKEG